MHVHVDLFGSGTVITLELENVSAIDEEEGREGGREEAWGLRGMCMYMYKF